MKPPQLENEVVDPADDVPTPARQMNRLNDDQTLLAWLREMSLKTADK